MERKMTLEEFSEYVQKGVKEGLPYELRDAKANIIYGRDWYSRIEINRPWTNVTVSYLLTFEYREYLSGKCTPEFVIANILNNRSLYHVPIDFCNMDVSDFDSIKSRIVSRILSSKPQYEELLKNRPVKYYKDLQIAMVWDFHSVEKCYYSEGEIVRMPVTWEMMNEWGISLDDLEQIAQKNTPLLRPAQIRFLDEIVREERILCEECELSKCESSGIVVVTNQARQDGAIVVTYPGIHEAITDLLGDDVYILPSSIHECMAVAKGNQDPEQLYQMVCGINAEKVAAYEFLADDVLEYTQDGQLTSAIHRTNEENTVEENSIFM